MSISFSGSELINIAIGIEKRGIAFYDIMTKSAKNATTRDVFHRSEEVLGIVEDANQKRGKGSMDARRSYSGNAVFEGSCASG